VPLIIIVVVVLLLLLAAAAAVVVIIILNKYHIRLSIWSQQLEAYSCVNLNSLITQFKQ
jgi:hypothetical protein